MRRRAWERRTSARPRAARSRGGGPVLLEQALDQDGHDQVDVVDRQPEGFLAVPDRLLDVVAPGGGAGAGEAGDLAGAEDARRDRQRPAGPALAGAGVVVGLAALDRQGGLHVRLHGGLDLAAPGLLNRLEDLLLAH